MPTSFRRPRRSMLPLALAAAAVGLSAAVSYVPAARADFPTPSIAPIAWEVDFEYRTPKRILVDLPGQSGPTAFWYMVYEVVNDSDEEIFFRPDVDLQTQDGKVLPANYNLPPAVFDAINRRTRSLNLQRAQNMVGKLLVGEDRGKAGVAIWREPSAEMGSFDIFFEGLSGEIARVTGPDGKEMTDADGNPIIVRKTKHLSFKIRGDDINPGNDEVVRTGDRWIMR